MYNCVIVIGWNDKASSKAFFCFGSICGACYGVTGCVIYVVLKLVPEYLGLITWGDNRKLEIKSRDGEVLFF